MYIHFILYVFWILIHLSICWKYFILIFFLPFNIFNGFNFFFFSFSYTENLISTCSVSQSYDFSVSYICMHFYFNGIYVLYVLPSCLVSLEFIYINGAGLRSNFIICCRNQMWVLNFSHAFGRINIKLMIMIFLF